MRNQAQASSCRPSKQKGPKKKNETSVFPDNIKLPKVSLPFHLLLRAEDRGLRLGLALLSWLLKELLLGARFLCSVLIMVKVRPLVCLLSSTLGPFCKNGGLTQSPSTLTWLLCS